MAANLSELTDDYLFRARNKYPATDYAAQKTWLYELYEQFAENGDAEVTATTFKGSSSTLQFRSATPEGHRLALKAAIEKLEDLIAGATAESYRKPFGIRWTSAPAIALDNAAC
jgi:hypothetical protein